MWINITLRDSLLKASRHFATEADILNKGESLLWWRSPEGPDPERNQQAATLLDQAYTSYRGGIEAIEQAIEKFASNTTAFTNH